MPISRITAGVPTASRRDANSHPTTRGAMCRAGAEPPASDRHGQTAHPANCREKIPAIVNLPSLTLTKLSGDDPEAYLITLEKVWERSTG